MEEINWEKAKTLKVETKKFDGKVHKALEIQRHQCSPLNGGINRDNGQFVKTNFQTPFLKFLRKKGRNYSTADIS